MSIPAPFNSYQPRVAIVTGSAQGIGLVVALRLAADGFAIAINDVPEKKKEIAAAVEKVKKSKEGAKVTGVAADVSDETSVKDMVETVAKELGSVDVMIANAGLGSPTPFLETTGEYFEKVMSINAKGIFLCFKYAALQMIKQQSGGRLVGASSSAGKQATLNLTAYSASKFAIRGITQAASIELREHGITANSYCPGVIATDTLRAMLGDVQNGLAIMKQTLGMPPDTPHAEADVVASFVSYLVKPEAYFVNGQSVNVDGGLRYD